jgi:hypothetical protein
MAAAPKQQVCVGCFARAKQVGVRCFAKAKQRADAVSTSHLSSLSWLSKKGGRKLPFFMSKAKIAKQLDTAN